MKIAQVAPLWESIPPPKYGGTERIVYYLTEGLVKKGHDVTLFASGDSQTSAKLVSVYPRPLFRDNIPWTNIMYPLLNITEVFDRQEQFDIIHIHLNKSSDYIALPMAVPIKKKVLFTFHFPYPIANNHKDRHTVLQKYKDLQYTSISNSQRQGGENLNWIKTVYNGIDINLYKVHENKGEYLLWLGKFNPDKGTKDAILTAKKLGMKIFLAGKIDELENADSNYYHQEIKPLIDNKQVVPLGELCDKDKNKIYGDALAFLNPIKWNEPFGLVMAEAQASGTPVISYANGAAPEIIKDGINGFLVNESEGIDGLTKAVEKLRSLSDEEYIHMRQAARKNIEENFSIKRMVNEYEKAYNQILGS
ncbi:MAG: glycosyltransferase family 4 protein [Candidatus Roizmanbacteria bacterium]|nr:MAG: glycosyltransferase family 4 protein [Candidatus Roizmanbacteria bacterium]